MVVRERAQGTLGCLIKSKKKRETHLSFLQKNKKKQMREMENKKKEKKSRRTGVLERAQGTLGSFNKKKNKIVGSGLDLTIYIYTFSKWKMEKQVL